MKWVSALALATAMCGQQLDLSVLDKLAARAKSSANVTLDEDKLKFASGFLSNDDPNQSAAKIMVGGLKAINVRVFEFDAPGQYAVSDVEVLRKQLRAPGWSKIIDVKDRDETAEIYMFGKGKDSDGITIIASSKKELAVVNIVGPVDLKTLGALSGKFGIPKDLGISAPKPPNPPKKDD